GDEDDGTDDASAKFAEDDDPDEDEDEGDGDGWPKESGTGSASAAGRVAAGVVVLRRSSMETATRKQAAARRELGQHSLHSRLSCQGRHGFLGRSAVLNWRAGPRRKARSEEHTSELQSR